MTKIGSKLTNCAGKSFFQKLKYFGPKKICFKVLLAQGNMEVYGLLPKNIFLILFVTPIGSKWSKNHENRPKLVLRFFHAFFKLFD